MVEGGEAGGQRLEGAAEKGWPMSGESEVEIERGEWVGDGGGVLRYVCYKPTEVRSDALVVLGHGFLRSGKTLAGLAEEVAAQGVGVVVPELRRSRPWAGRHAENAGDMMGLAGHLGAQRVVYAGFSAGGLSALLAAAADPRAVGFLGLDLVDDGTGAGAAERVGFPLHGLMAPPSRCNAGGNGRAVYAAAAEARVVEIAGASHCDFEWPGDWKCLLLCGRPRSGRSGEEIRGEILRQATKMLVEASGG